MTAVRLRELERAAITDGPEAEAAWLRYRADRTPERSVLECQNSECDRGMVAVRDGRVLPGRAGPTLAVIGQAPCSMCHGTGFAPFSSAIQLCAYLGDPGARLVEPICSCGSITGSHADAWRNCSRDLGRTLSPWARALARWGGVVAVRAACAGARLVHEECCACSIGVCDRADHSRTRLAVESAEAWIACPCEEHYQAWAKAWNHLGDAQGWILAPGRHGSSPSNLASLLSECARLTSESAIRTAIMDSLVPWALGRLT